MEFITQDLSPRRAELLARLAAERANLLLRLEGLDETTLSDAPVAGGQTVAEMLAHLAFREAHAADRFGKLAGGRYDEIQSLGDENADDETMRARFAGIPFDEALALLLKERRGFLLALGQVDNEALTRPTALRTRQRETPHRWAARLYQRDAEQAAMLARWRKTMPPNDPILRAIHRALLRPILALSRREFLALASLVPEAKWETRPLDGTWTLKQMVGHLADYEGLGVVALKAVAAEREPVYKTPIPDFEAFNVARGVAWGEETWNEVWANYLANRHALLLIADTLSDEALARPFPAPWLETTTACGFLLDMAQHEQEHADALRRALGLRPLPRRLGRA